MGIWLVMSVSYGVHGHERILFNWQMLVFWRLWLHKLDLSLWGLFTFQLWWWTWYFRFPDSTISFAIFVYPMIYYIVKPVIFLIRIRQLKLLLYSTPAIKFQNISNWNSNKTSFIGYMDNTMIKFPEYGNYYQVF